MKNKSYVNNGNQLQTEKRNQMKKLRKAFCEQKWLWVLWLINDIRFDRLIWQLSNLTDLSDNCQFHFILVLVCITVHAKIKTKKCSSQVRSYFTVLILWKSRTIFCLPAVDWFKMKSDSSGNCNSTATLVRRDNNKFQSLSNIFNYFNNGVLHYKNHAH